MLSPYPHINKNLNVCIFRATWPQIQANYLIWCSSEKQWSVLTLQENLASLVLLGCNEFSVHAIKIQEREICQAVSTQITAKVSSQVCDKTLMKTERGLNLRLKDSNHKHVPTDGKCCKVM
jgi:hypothetical protein